MTRGGDTNWRQLELDPEELARTAMYEARAGRAYRETRPMAAATLLTTAGMHYALVEPAAALEALEEASNLYLEYDRPFGALVAASTGKSEVTTSAAQTATVQSVISLVIEGAASEPDYFTNGNPAENRGPERQPREFDPENPVLQQPADEDLAAILAVQFSLERLRSDERISPHLSQSLVDLIDLSDSDFLWGGLFTLRDVAEIVTSGSDVNTTAQVVLERSALALREAMRDQFHWRSLTGWPPLSPETLWLGQVLLQQQPRTYEGLSGLARIPVEVAASFQA